jgi:hypothetical protein
MGILGGPSAERKAIDDGRGHRSRTGAAVSRWSEAPCASRRCEAKAVGATPEPEAVTAAQTSSAPPTRECRSAVALDRDGLSFAKTSSDSLGDHPESAGHGR